jgi:galactokinase
MGQLMRASHNSLRDDFEVSCKELDILVDIANQFTLGSRMTGGGFGGCTVSLLNKSQIDSVVAEMYERYAKATGGKATFYVCEPAEGARLIDLTNYL